MKSKWIVMGALLLLTVAALAACASEAPAPATEAEGEVAAQPCPTAAPCPECPECPAPEPAAEVPFQDVWAASAHADAEAEAFVHWDEEGEVPESCAMCHSTPGYLDYLGADGSEAFVVNQPAEIGTVITCDACHNEVTTTLNSVTFPSGAEVTGFEEASRCMVCHQGRSSTVQVVNAIADAGVEGEADTVSADLGFVNIHYYAAAATLLGSDVHGGYEYEGQSYQARFQHVEDYNTCNECHSPHSLEVRVDDCATCHTGVAAVEDLRDVRMQGSLADYDGDGDLEEGIYYEIQGLQELLYQAMQSYASEVAGTAIVYDEQTHPYFFIDGNGNGEVDEGEATRDNAYNAFTPRLLEAAYNYQVAVKDPGAFAHNAKYIIQLLYDSTASLNEQLGEPVDLSAVHRDDPGHFAGTAEAFRHWDEDGMVPDTCSKCHSAEGLPTLLTTGAAVAVPPSDSLSCLTCHQDYETFAVYEVAEVTMPNGATVSLADNPESNLCLNCHQGRESTVSVDAAIEAAAVGDDTVSEALRFRNPHYFAAGATLFGSEAQGMYQYAGQTYSGKFAHIGGFDSCQECHGVHSLQVRAAECEGCHGTTELETIRQPDGEPIDYDGDGDTDEGIAMEVETMHEALLAAIEEYAATTIGTPIVYDASRYPYWLTEDGEGYAGWTPTLLRAAYNYQWVAKDPGAFAHNGDYVMQALYDSIQAIGGPQAVQGMTRPAAPAP